MLSLAYQLSARKNAFWVVSILLLLLTFLTNKLLLSENVYYNYIANQLPDEKIDLVVQESKRWHFAGYVLVILVYLIKIMFVAACLSLAIVFRKDKFEIKKMFLVAATAEYVFLLPIIIKIAWFSFGTAEYTLEDLQYFYPLSGVNVFQREYLEPWLVYPLQVLNIFEVVYWILLAYLVTKELPEINLSSAMTIVLSSYGVGLVVWVAFVMFLTLAYT